MKFSHKGFAGLDPFFALLITILCCKGLVRTRDLLFEPYLQVRAADVLFALAFLILWRLCFSSLQLYDTFATIPSRLNATIKGVLLMTLPIVLYFQFVKQTPLPASTIAILAAALFAFEMNRITVAVYLPDLIARRDPRRAIILGTGPRASKAWRRIRTRYHGSMTLLGFIDDRSINDMAPEVAHRYLGSIDQLDDILLNKVVDTILIAMPIRSCYPLMQRVVTTAASVGVDVICLDDTFSTRNLREDPGQSIFRQLAPRQDRHLQRLMLKRTLDVVVSSIALILLSPLLIAVAILVKLTSPGPAFFCQPRYGKRRRLFKIIKFRTMVHNAEDLLPELEHLNEADGPIFKIRRDPRVTKLGRLLRVTSIDELPQLWNVLMGQMSLVGPRPMSIRDVSRFSDAMLMRRFSVTPGMTGLWQVSGRSNVGFDQWVVLDSRYIDNWSLSLDLKILLSTIGVVLKTSDAI